jgi:hypothetical protein
MTTTIAGFSTLSTEGIDLTATYTGYSQTSAVSSTNVPEYPGPTGPFTLGQVTKGVDGSEWVYCLAGSAISLGDVVIITNTTTLWTGNSVTSTLASSKLGDLVGVAPLVAIGSGSYGWIQRSGKCSAVSVIASVTANVQLKTTTTAGRLTSTLATGATVNINGIVLATANGGAAGNAQGILNFPVVGSND